MSIGKGMLIILIILAGWTPWSFSQAIFRVGNPDGVGAEPLPGIVLAGGGADNDDAMRWMLQRAGGGDVVIIRASGGDGYNSYFFSELGVTLNSVTTMVVSTSEHANSQQVRDILTEADLVFIAGGDQWNYIRIWRDTRLLETLNQLIASKGITIGGSSAGMAVLGEVVFTAENNTVWTSEALGDPYHRRMTLEKDFLAHPLLRHTITDSHYDRIQGDGQDRHGRHLAFMARMVADWHMPARGIAAPEGVAIAVDEQGKARVFGDPSKEQYAFFLQAYGGAPEECETGQRLRWQNDGKAVKVYRIRGDRQGSGWFDLDGWMHGQGGMWEFWEVSNRNLREEPSYALGRWLRIEVRDARDSTLLEGAQAGLVSPDDITFPKSIPPHPVYDYNGDRSQEKSSPPLVTPVFGMVNFEGINAATTYTLHIRKEGYYSFDGEVPPGEDNLAIKVYLQRDDTSVQLPRHEYNSNPWQLETFPNPATDVLWIRLPEALAWKNQTTTGSESLQISVFDSGGRLMEAHLIEDFSGESIPVKISTLPTGLYFLEVRQGVRRMVGRFVR